MDFKLEICVDSVESAVIAQEAGADRLEICCALAEGGLTPGYGLIRSVIDNSSIPVHVLIRPRGGDFLYTDNEFEIMRKDIEICGECGVHGVVFGLLDADGSIDVERSALLVEFAKPMSVTFHRAFDVCSDPLQALKDIIDAGADRLLTSGQKSTAYEGAGLIRKLLERAAEKIIIMPGGGINESNIEEIAKITGAKEFHLSARILTESGMKFRNEEILKTISGGGYSRKIASRDMILAVAGLLKKI
ncbi:MAG TPA: copper homeostasis protein CutC [Bacteroidales bacterium]|nr:copper homeostasis protein CutC [Bacteroidales bacterium]HOK75914.1 copper homeostasis protein CutC [Bacteroidales bacterium]HQG56930.1 copper homeostasis protein CutC [Bacteroidales bacterium]HRR17378.1 copper homeostasis protein CutC [Bacteroidales bacterium]HRT48761.1 copper homeostasis protein CutC [Bacteroidales bacterium]